MAFWMQPTRQAEELVDLPHPLAVASRQVVVDRDQVHAPAGQGVQVERHGGDQRLAFAGGHLGDLALVQHDAADELDVVGHHVPGARRCPATVQDAAAQPPAGLLDRGEGLGQQVVEGLPVGQAGAEFGRLGAAGPRPEGPGYSAAKRLISSTSGCASLDVPVVLGAEDGLQQ